MDKKNVAFKVIDRLFIVVYGASAPTDAEWLEFLKAVEAHGSERTMHLVFTECGAPTKIQRRYLSELLSNHGVSVAVVSANKMIRGLVAAVSWFNMGIRAFPPEAVDKALAFLGVPANQLETVLQEAQALKNKVCRIV